MNVQLTEKNGVMMPMVDEKDKKNYEKFICGVSFQPFKLYMP